MILRLRDLLGKIRGEDSSPVGCPLHFTHRSRGRLLWKKLVSRSA